MTAKLTPAQKRIILMSASHRGAIATTTDTGALLRMAAAGLVETYNDDRGVELDRLTFAAYAATAELDAAHTAALTEADHRAWVARTAPAPQHTGPAAQLDLFGNPAPELAPQPSLFHIPTATKPAAPLAAELHTDALPLDSTYRRTGLIENMTDAELLITHRLERDSDARARYLEIDAAAVPGTVRTARRELARLDRRIAIMRRVAAERGLDLRTPAERAADAARTADADARLTAQTDALRESERTTADLITAAQPAPVPARQTWHAAGRPATALYYGRGIDPSPRPILVTVNDHGNRVYDARTGTQIAHYASAVPMWLAAAPIATPTPVVIIPCGGKKLDHPAPAGQLYVGSYHAATRRAAAAIAARTGARILILSALHGLTDPATVIAPYDLRMGRPGSVTATHVAAQAAQLGILAADVTVLAGRKYADVVTAVWPAATRPLDGTRGIGPQLARLARIRTSAYALVA